MKFPVIRDDLVWDSEVAEEFQDDQFDLCIRSLMKSVVGAGDWFDGL